jgi:hypothetical protein
MNELDYSASARATRKFGISAIESTRLRCNSFPTIVTTYTPPSQEIMTGDR